MRIKPPQVPIELSKGQLDALLRALQLVKVEPLVAARQKIQKARDDWEER